MNEGVDTHAQEDSALKARVREPLDRSSAETDGDGLRVGQTVGSGRYVLLEVLSHGSTTLVFRVMDTQREQEVALKVLTRAVVEQPDEQRRLRREAEFLRRVEHANIARFVDEGTLEDGRGFLAEELIPGRTLGSALVETPRIEPEHTCRIARQIASGLGALHDADLVHRSLTPDNILLLGPPGGEVVKLIDLSATVEREAPVRGFRSHGDRAHNGEHKGQYRYMAPEHLQKRPAKPAMDIFAFGVMLYEMLAGENPYAHLNPEQLRRAHESKPGAITIRTKVFDAPEELLALVGDCMARDPAKRPPSMEEVIQRIDRALLWMGVVPAEIGDTERTQPWRAAEQVPRKRKIVSDSGKDSDSGQGQHQPEEPGPIAADAKQAERHDADAAEVSSSDEEHDNTKRDKARKDKARKDKARKAKRDNTKQDTAQQDNTKQAQPDEGKPSSTATSAQDEQPRKSRRNQFWRRARAPRTPEPMQARRRWRRGRREDSDATSEHNQQDARANTDKPTEAHEPKPYSEPEPPPSTADKVQADNTTQADGNTTKQTDRERRSSSARDKVHDAQQRGRSSAPPTDDDVDEELETPVSSQSFDPSRVREFDAPSRSLVVDTVAWTKPQPRAKSSSSASRPSKTAKSQRRPSYPPSDPRSGEFSSYRDSQTGRFAAQSGPPSGDWTEPSDTGQYDLLSGRARAIRPHQQMPTRRNVAIRGPSPLLWTAAWTVIAVVASVAVWLLVTH